MQSIVSLLKQEMNNKSQTETLLSRSKAMKSEQLLILFGSQTGNAEWISKHIYSESLERGYKAQVMCLNDSIEYDWTLDFALIVVTSSTGDGDPPDNSNKFLKWLRKNPGLDGKKYAILGLGDTNYTNFCNTAKRIDRKLIELGIILIIYLNRSCSNVAKRFGG